MAAQPLRGVCGGNKGCLSWTTNLSPAPGICQTPEANSAFIQCGKSQGEAEPIPLRLGLSHLWSHHAPVPPWRGATLGW